MLRLCASAVAAKRPLVPACSRLSLRPVPSEPYTRRLIADYSLNTFSSNARLRLPTPDVLSFIILFRVSYDAYGGESWRKKRLIQRNRSFSSAAWHATGV